MNSSILDVIVIGAGHAGLGISYYLNKLKINHLVFEKGQVGETWRSQRWDSFKFNTPIKVNLLPGEENTLTDVEEFWTAGEFVSLLEDYTHIFNLPVLENCEVLFVEKAAGSDYFSVTVKNGGLTRLYNSKQVIVASGAQNRKFNPEYAGNIPDEIVQLHASEYKNPSMLPDGTILVIGSAQSGVQITEDLIDSGKQVYLSTSPVARVPRRYRGKDIVEWLNMIGYYDMKTTDIKDPGTIKARFPQISGVGKQGHTVSLQSLAKKGAVILGRTMNADSSVIYIQPDAVSNIQFADEASKTVKGMIDRYIIKSGALAPDPEEDASDYPDLSGGCASDITRFNLKEHKVSTIIWTIGFKGDFSYLKVPVFDEGGNLVHNEGESNIEGLYFLGLPWMRKRKSGIIMGVREDAEYILMKLLARKGVML
jgi:putative flavoprotein involved in K+ transport